MGAMPRLLVLIGSGETAPSIAPLHRDILGRIARAAGRPPRVTILDTPYGFQENAADITASAVDFFERRLGTTATVASMRRSDGGAFARIAALARIRGADYVFSGPGSPSYALRHWSATDVPRLLSEKLAGGGAIVMASAAALTLGRVTPPIYEIYKVGEDPRWLPGLDLLSPIGFPVAVIPHFNNAEGQGHDTRYCFLGERRLCLLEAELPDDTFLLGIDEHTALVLDIDARQATVHGRGHVTVRRQGTSTTFAPGTTTPFAALREAAFPADGPGPRQSPAAPGATEPGPRVEAAFRAALDRGDVAAALTAIEALDEERGAGGSAARRAMLAELAASIRADLTAPLLDELVAARLVARRAGDWTAADAIRDRLRALGVELHDQGEASTWSRPDPGAAPR